MSQRGDSGRKNIAPDRNAPNTIWKAIGKRQAMSRGAKEKARVSQFEMLKPVIQLAVWRVSFVNEVIIAILTHLDNNEFPSAVHLTRLGLPNASCCCICPCAESCYDASYHHAGDCPAAGLDNRPDTDDGGAKQNLTWASENVSRPYGTHGADEASDVVDRCHYTLEPLDQSWWTTSTYLACLQTDIQRFARSSRL